MADEVTLDEQIAEVEREIRLREVVYPRWVAAPKPKLSQTQADKQLGRLRAVRATLAQGRTARALLREFVTDDNIVNYDSTHCWGCGELKTGLCDSTCLVYRSRIELGIEEP